MNEPVNNEAVHPAVAKLFLNCFEIFDQRQYTEVSSFHEFFRAVGCQDAGLLITALREWIATGTRFPLPSDIKQLVMLLGNRKPD